MKNSSDRKRDAEMLKASYADYENHRYDEAKAAACELVKNSPEFSGGWDLLGLCYKGLAKENSEKGPSVFAETRAFYDQAIDAFKKALDLEPRREKSWLHLGWVYDTYIVTAYDENTEVYSSEKIDAVKAKECYIKAMELDRDHKQLIMNKYDAFKNHQELKVPKINIKNIKRTKLQQALEADFEKKQARLKAINDDLLKIITAKPKEILSELSKLDENEIVAYFKEGLEGSLETLDPAKTCEALYFAWSYTETTVIGIKKYHLTDRENPFQILEKPENDPAEENNGFGNVAVVLDSWVPGIFGNEGLRDIYRKNEHEIPSNLYDEYKALENLYDGLFTAKLNQLLSLAYGLITAPKPGYVLFGRRSKPKSTVLLAAP